MRWADLKEGDVVHHGLNSSHLLLSTAAGNVWLDLDTGRSHNSGEFHPDLEMSSEWKVER